MTRSKTPGPTPIGLLQEIAELMHIQGENPFKIRAFERAADALSECDDLEDRAKKGTLTELDGVGKGIAEVLTDLILHQKTPVLDDLKKSIPAAVLELVKIPGVGPKKAQHLHQELGIESVQELEYACKENRLLKLKGFGPKLQDKILEGIALRLQSVGKQRLDQALESSVQILTALRSKIGNEGRVEETGALRRRCEILSGLDYLIAIVQPEQKKKLTTFARDLEAKDPSLLPIHLEFTDAENFDKRWVETTGSEEHLKSLHQLGKLKNPGPLGSQGLGQESGEAKYYAHYGLMWIPPEARETGEEVTLAQKKSLSQLLPEDGIQGIFHNHTTRSDGAASLEEMVVAAKQAGYRYIGISDHSQSAFYAQGLKVQDLKEQEKEVRKIQDKHPEIKIFWGIESDILADGSLDYSDKVLSQFDFVIASIHSRFQMDRTTMTERILTAIRHPATRFIGHLTGRLLLGRKGYEVDIEKIIQEAARHQVAIELNSHPQRLDIDWRWGPHLKKYQTLISVNPDAHETQGIQDVKYGVWMARKALLPSELVLNTRSADEVAQWLAQ